MLRQSIHHAPRNGSIPEISENSEIRGTSALRSRLIRGALVLASAGASIATFGGDPGWEMHVQKSSPVATDVELTSASPEFTSDFHANGAGTGARELALDGAVELRTSGPVATPVQVRLRLVSAVATIPVQEEIRYVNDRTTFVSVASSVRCVTDVACIHDATLEVTVVSPAELGGSTLGIHWVTTASLSGRGPAAPADARLALTQP